MKSSPSEKFAFLLKACGSESVQESLDKGVINVNAIKERIKAVEYDRNRFISKLDLLKTHATNYQMIDSTCSQINLLKLKRVWVPYHTCRLAVREIETELSVLQNQESSLHRNLSEMMKEHPLSSIKPAPTTENHLSSLREELVFENQRFYDTKKRHSGLLEEIRCLQEEKNEVLKNYTQIETLIVSSKDIGKEGTKNLTQQLKQVEESIGSTQIQLAKLIEKEESEKVELATIQNLHREMVENLKSSETSLRKHLEDQSRYTSSTRNRGELYFPSKFKSLVESIRSEKFIHKVKGPIGLFLKIDPRYSEYAKAIETAIGQNILKSFLVECIEDQRKMSKLLKAYNLDFTVKVTCIDEPKAKKHDYTPETKFLTVMNALVVDDIDIFNMLLDQYNLDRLALFPSEEQMYSTLVSETNGRKHFTGNISKVFFQNGSSYVYKDGNTGSFSRQGNFKGLIASSDTSAILDELKKNIYSKESMVKQIKEEERSLFQQCNDLRQCLYQKSEAKKQFSTKLRNLDSKLSSLREEIQDNENINPNPNEDLKKDLQVLESHRNYLDELLHEKERIQEKLKKMQHPWLLCKGKKIQNHFFCIFAFLPFWTKTQLNQNFEWI
jgi:chromosome segregation ATPase